MKKRQRENDNALKILIVLAEGGATLDMIHERIRKLEKARTSLSEEERNLKTEQQSDMENGSTIQITQSFSDRFP